MDFLIAAQDIGEMSLGYRNEHGEIFEESFSIAPEQYLQTIETFFSKHQISLEKIKRIFVVPGPGSFTASRVSVTIVNTIAFTQNIPVISLPNPEKQSFSQLLEGIRDLPTKESPFVLPLYDRPPMITQAKP